VKQVSSAGVRLVSKPVIGADPPDAGIRQGAVPHVGSEPGSEAELADLLAEIGLLTAGLDLIIVEHIVDIQQESVTW